MTTLEELPPELLANVLTYLDDKSLSTFCQVNKDKNLCEEEWQLRARKRFNIPPNFITDNWYYAYKTLNNIEGELANLLDNYVERALNRNNFDAVANTNNYLKIINFLLQNENDIKFFSNEMITYLLDFEEKMFGIAKLRIVALHYRFFPDKKAPFNLLYTNLYMYDKEELIDWAEQFLEDFI